MANERGNVATLEAIGNNLAETELLPRLYHARLISIDDAESLRAGMTVRYDPVPLSTFGSLSCQEI